MRVKRIIIFSVVIVILLAAAVYVRNLGNQHRFVDTAGDIVFASDHGGSGKSHIFLVKKDKTVVQITTGSSDDTAPSFSPDGSQIAFVSDRSGSQQIWVMDSDGKGARDITIGSDAKSKPRFGPDGYHIAYLAGGRLYVNNLNGGSTAMILPSQSGAIAGDTEQLAQAARQPVTNFAWSPVNNPTKSQLAAIQETPDGNLQTVGLIPSGGGKPNVIVGAPEVSVGWSPDGSQLAVALLGAVSATDKKPFSGIVLYDAQGIAVPQPPIAALPSAQTGPQAPSFSPDSTKIAFSLIQQSTPGVDLPIGIGIAPAAGRTEPQIPVRGPAGTPAFSPDGANLLFLAALPKSPDTHGLFVANLSTGKAAQVPGTGNVTEAEWSPYVGKGK